MSAIAIGAVVVGAGASIGASYLKKKPPGAAAFQDVNLQSEQGNAIGGNIAAFKSASKLAGMTNTFNASEIQRMNELSMPGYKAMQSKGTANIMDWMSGKVPEDVSNAVRTQSASRAMAGGFGGTGMGRNLSARDLGMTSLDVMSKGMDSATRWMQMNQSQAKTFDVSSMFVTPGQSANFAANQRDAKLSYTNDANAYNYANDPNTAARDQLAGMVGNLGSGMANYLGSGISSTKSSYTSSGGSNGFTAGTEMNKMKQYGS